MKTRVRLAVAGVGLIGRRHALIVKKGASGTELTAVIDPSAEGRRFAESIDTPWHASLSDFFSNDEADGMIIATPNQVHVENGLDCVAAGCPMLLEKPIATSSVEAKRLIRAAKENDVPILVGHHRRHNPIIQQARSLIQNGLLGQLLTVSSTCWLRKPSDYFTSDWRKNAGAGPVMINLIHDIDLLRFLCGEIVGVQALLSNVARGFQVEDTTVALLRFDTGVLGTISLSDAVAAPWSWELCSGENPEFASTIQSCYLIGGTDGSLSIPNLRFWRHENNGHWKSPISATSFSRENVDPLVAQVQHFANVILRIELPLVSGDEAMRSLRVIEAVLQSASSNSIINPIEEIVVN